MKKLLIITAFLLGGILSTKAEVVEKEGAEVVYTMAPEQKIEMYDFSNFNVKRLSIYLKLDEEQEDEVRFYFDQFSRNMLWVFEQPNRKLLLNNALELHLKGMALVLSKKQYHKYLRVLNAEFMNRGIDWV